MASMSMPRAPSLQEVLLCCPACGSERLLREAEGLPHGLACMMTSCPACEGHGRDAPVLIFDDGRIVGDKPGTRVARRLLVPEWNIPLENEARG